MIQDEAPAYIHFLDLYHHARAQRNHHPTAIAVEARRALRIAAAAFDHCYLPASSFFESPLARYVVGDHPLLAASGRINLIAADASLEDHREAKVRQYGPTSPMGLDLVYSKSAQTTARYQQRNDSARRAIEFSWQNEVATGQLRRRIDPTEREELPSDLENSWSRVPEELGDLAFIPAHAHTLLAQMSGTDRPSVQSHVTRLIERAYMDSYVRELGAGLITDLVSLASPFELARTYRSVSYSLAMRRLIPAGLTSVLDAEEVEFLHNEDLIRAVVAADRRPGQGPLLAMAQVAHTIRQPTFGGLLRAAGGAKLAAPTIGIVTALGAEWGVLPPLLSDLEDWPSPPNDSNRYTGAWLPTESGGRLGVVVTHCPRMGNKSSAGTVSRLCAAFESIETVVMCGIAGAIPRPGDPNKDVGLGDVVVAARAGVVDLDHGVARPGGRESRSNLPPPSARLAAIFDECHGGGGDGRVRFERTVQEHLDLLQRKDRRFQRPLPEHDVLHDRDLNVIRPRGRNHLTIFAGLIASGDTLVKDPTHRDLIGDSTGALAIEMEGAGLAEAAHGCARQYFLVRGLVDYCDTRKNDVWHGYAAAAAGAVTVTILSLIRES